MRCYALHTKKRICLIDADAKRVLIERYLDAYNSFDVERIWEVLDRDIERNASGGKVNVIASGANEFQELAEQSKRLFSSRQTVTKWELDGDKASVKVIIQACWL